METRLQEKCDLFIKNREAISRKFPFEKSLMKAAAALMALSDRDTDLILKDMEECYLYLKKTCKLGASSNALPATHLSPVPLSSSRPDRPH
ncbi:MAG: hypothetical protein J5783_07915 [Lachnospiraceae bacterium]|nr:hypothetical protein [Lachnospiraceae bacterium]